MSTYAQRRQEAEQYHKRVLEQISTIFDIWVFLLIAMLVGIDVSGGLLGFAAGWTIAAAIKGCWYFYREGKALNG